MQRHRRLAKACSSLLLLGVLSACAGDAVPVAPLRAIAVELESVSPPVLLPGSRIVVTALSAFPPAQDHVLRITKGAVQIDLPITIDERHGEAVLTREQFHALGEGTGSFAIRVVTQADRSLVIGPALPATSLRLTTHLTPVLSGVEAGLVFINSPVPVRGAGLLLGADEGQSVAQLRGCFQPKGSSSPCRQADPPTVVEIPVTSDGEAREIGRFPFGASIAGVRPGRFEGDVRLVNRHKDGTEKFSAWRKAMAFDLVESRFDGFGDDGVLSLGKIIELRGRGFAGGVGGGTTTLLFEGEFAAATGDVYPLTMELFVGVDDLGQARYALQEGEGIGESILFRDPQTGAPLPQGHGTIRGSWTLVLRQGSQTFLAPPSYHELTLGPIRQVVWLNFTSGWHDGLRRFGMQAAEPKIRARAIEVLRERYRGVNIEFRQEKPTDFLLFSQVDIAGKDPAGRGLYGLDATPSIDVHNLRLDDRLGGFNAETGVNNGTTKGSYGGIFFTEFLMNHTEHLPPDAYQGFSPDRTPVFDRLFDPFRPDRGREMTSSEAISASTLYTMSACPSESRPLQAACAIRVLGNMLGVIVAHEVGHSLGLAFPPLGREPAYHLEGDGPRRIMDTGGFIPFEEKTGLSDLPEFCDQIYSYLTTILPTDNPATDVLRSPCR